MVFDLNICIRRVCQRVSLKSVGGGIFDLTRVELVTLERFRLFVHEIEVS